MQSKGKVMVGMSGGVDSSVAALLLQREGYEVVGVTFRLWDPGVDSALGESSCCAADDVNDARFVCDALGIPHYVVNYKELFRETVVDYFVEEYRRGATPNPCIECNRNIKFGAFLHKARSMGFDFIATGHYANAAFDEVRGRYRLSRGSYDRKDQSYFLYTLTQDQLSAIRMPLGPYHKDEVRRLAEEKNLVVSKKAESQDICFVPDGDYTGFLEAYTGNLPPEGDFVDPQGNILGRHKGIWRYTIGQRKGLGVGFGKPVYVSAIDAARNRVTLSDNDALMTSELTADRLNWIDFDRLGQPIRVLAKIRYGARPSPAVVQPDGPERVRVLFEQPQRAVTPGQAVVFYEGDYVIGGGTIC